MKERHGYLIMPRQAILLLDDLGHEQYGFYLSLVYLATWDRRNPHFRYVTKSQVEIAKFIKKDQATVHRYLRTLADKKYIVRHIKHRLIYLTYLPLFLYDVGAKMHSMDFANLQELYVEMQAINARVQEAYARMQEKRDQYRRKDLYTSFKDNLSSFHDEQYVDPDDIPF